MSCHCEPERIVITTAIAVDDDFRVRIGALTVFDPRRLGFQSRAEIVIARDVHARYRCRVLPGARVSIDTFDGWGNGWSTQLWLAEVFWAGGRRWWTRGGIAASGVSPGLQPVPVGDYFTTGPHFTDYHRNGGFVIPCPPI